MSNIRCNYSFIPHKHGHNRQQLYYDGLFDEFFNSLMVDCSPLIFYWKQTKRISSLLVPRPTSFYGIFAPIFRAICSNRNYIFTLDGVLV